MDTPFYKKKKIWIPLLAIGIIGIITLFVIFYNTSDSFIIPYGYTGKITVVYVPQGTPETNSINTKRIFHIPANGLLFAPYSPRSGFVNRQFYYEKPDGSSVALYQEINHRMPSGMSDSVLINVDGFSKPDTLKYGNSAISFQLEIVKLKW